MGIPNSYNKVGSRETVLFLIEAGQSGVAGADEDLDVVSVSIWTCFNVDEDDNVESDDDDGNNIRSRNCDYLYIFFLFVS